MYKTIRQVATFQATPHEIYEMLMDAEKHAKFTGAPVEISREVGGKFSAFGGGLSGVNLELTPDQRIVQSWRGDDWPEGHYSTVTYELAAMDIGTALTFTQTGVPASEAEKISQGWVSYYWEKMAQQ